MKKICLGISLIICLLCFAGCQENTQTPEVPNVSNQGEEEVGILDNNQNENSLGEILSGEVEILAPSAESFKSLAKKHDETNGYTNDVGVWRVISEYGLYENGTFNHTYSPVYIKQRKLYTSEESERIIEDFNSKSEFTPYYTSKHEDSKIYIVLYDIDLTDFVSKDDQIIDAKLHKTVELELTDLSTGKNGTVYGTTYIADANSHYFNGNIDQLFLIFETPKDFTLSTAKIRFVNDDDYTYENFFISAFNS